MRKQIAKILGVLFIISIIPALVFGENPTFGRPKLVGTGCPRSRLSYTHAPDGTDMSVMFSAFKAETGLSDRSKCRIEVPIDVPEGMQVSSLNVDYRGLANIPEGGKGVVSRRYSIGGVRTRKQNTIYGLSPGFFYSDYPNVTARSRCGRDIVARANITLTVEDPTADYEKSLINLESIDWALQWTECGDW